VGHVAGSHMPPPRPPTAATPVAEMFQQILYLYKLVLYKTSNLHFLQLEAQLEAEPEASLESLPARSPSQPEPPSSQNPF
jgi:hypothetical protein